MFENTKVDDSYVKKIIQIDKYRLDARIKPNDDYLYSELGMEKYLIMLYNSWYQLDDGIYFFKHVKYINELFLSELIKEYRIKCVDSSLAKYKDRIGIIRKSFRQKDKKYYEYDDYFKNQNICPPKKLTILNHIFKETLSDKNRIKLMNSFYRLTAFDWFTGQNDRTTSNLIFEVGDEVNIAPITDNGGSLIYITEEQKELEKYYRIYMSSFDHLVFPTNEKMNKKSLYVINLINNHLEFYKYLCKSLDIDINKVLNRVIDKYHLILPQNDREMLISYFDKKKQILEKTLTIAKKYK